MFTGIIEATAEVQDVRESEITIARPPIFDDLTIGCSIAISGVCLSAVAFDEKVMTFNFAETTKKKTTLGSRTKGSKVNLERAMKAGGRFEGHIVQGHVEGVGEVIHAPTPNPSPGTGEGRRGGGVYRGIENFKYPVKTVVGNARGMRKNPTKAEKVLWEALRQKKFKGLYFRRQRPIGNFIVDFYSEELRLAVEVDGKYHEDSELREAEMMRDEFLLKRGVRTLHVTNNDVLKNLDAVLQRIERMLPPPTPPPRRGRGEGEGAQSELLTVRLPQELTQFVVQHGSITIDGVSLTVADLQDALVTVAIIPLTEKETTLGALKTGDHVNIETDILTKYLLKYANT